MGGQGGPKCICLQYHNNIQKCFRLIRRLLDQCFTGKQHRNKNQTHSIKTTETHKSYQLELSAPVVRVLDTTVRPESSYGWEIL